MFFQFHSVSTFFLLIQENIFLSLSLSLSLSLYLSIYLSIYLYLYLYLSFPQILIIKKYIDNSLGYLEAQ
jgi:hypothetical protein